MSVDMAALGSAADASVSRAQSESVAVSQVLDSTAQSFSSLEQIHPLEDPAAAVRDVGGAILGAVNIGAELTNTGVAVLTNSVSAVLPSFPVAHLGAMYLGIPHGHLHPPSLVPPAPVPIPLPTLGAITLGTCVQVLVGGMPAARVGDLGLAPTCGGLAPFFTVFLGSSKVFIGGTRAARMSDMCTACTPSTAGVARGLAKAMATASKAVAIASIAASAGAAVEASDQADAAATAAEAQMASAMSAGNAMNAGMQAAQMAADAIATALSATMGTDPAVPPGMIGFVTLGVPNILVAGMPMPNIPDPAHMLLKKLKGKLGKRRGKGNRKEAGGGGGCPGK
jgi:uncharacterized Zn-binding protein involved in type VI secretion